ncbi:MAG: class I SAM-dependent methyltransferase [Rikenellaceae bacterium]|nr:class I SAM-dependent methyltransferase [Rikenellaceae bacterium]
MKLLHPLHWSDYELIDSGDFEKLERFGKYTVRRPEPQALWGKSLNENEWDELADAVFLKDRKSDDRGEWKCRKGMPQQWIVSYSYKDMEIKMRLGLISFKHVGLFPEQSENWDYIYDAVRANPQGERRILNLFAYTGGASLAAASAGAEVTHVDSVKQVVTWSKENMELSGLSNIRWIVDDALKFVRREVKRGRKYNGIILDPPAYGRGPDGEKWILEEGIYDLLTCCNEILSEKDSFVVLNLYSMGLSALVAKTLANQVFGIADEEQYGEIYVPDRSEKFLPLGVFYRMKR